MAFETSSLVTVGQLQAAMNKIKMCLTAKSLWYSSLRELLLSQNKHKIAMKN